MPRSTVLSLAMSSSLLLTPLLARAEEEPVNPVPGASLVLDTRQWDFDAGVDGWHADHACTLSATGGILGVRCTGEDPYMHAAVDVPGGVYRVTVRARCNGTGSGQVFWAAAETPQTSGQRVVHLPLVHDGQWRESTSHTFHVGSRLTLLRIDPGGDAGELEIDWIRLSRIEPHPLTVRHIGVDDGAVGFELHNARPTPLVASVGGRSLTVPGGRWVPIVLPGLAKRPVEASTIEIASPGLPSVTRTLLVVHDDVPIEWIERPLGEFQLQVAPDGSIARLRRDGRIAAVIGPLVIVDGKVPELKRDAGNAGLRFVGDGVTLAIDTAENEINVAIDGHRPCEGPIVRPRGMLEQGLLAGLEYLGRGERSSSKLDVRTAEHLRFAPDPLKVTMPLSVIRTDRVTLALAWDDMRLQPIYAVPNFFDCTDDHRMGLRVRDPAGGKIRATIRVGTGPLAEQIVWAVRRNGLPPLPEAPRTVPQQWDLCMAALNGPLKTESGWGHCAEERWGRQPFSDHASTVWRLTGKAPELPRLTPGGAHVPNHTIYFVTGRAEQWLAWKRGQVANLIARQKPDGSFRYQGKYAEGHFEDTASGVCARPAATLLEYAYVTGDAKALAAGLDTLEYMKRFRTPRGAQTWECPLHIPDQLASAYLVWAYTRGFEMTGNEEYLAAARKWAASGIPFTYLWTSQPIMLYGTPPVFGATNWTSPCWIGLPVQWVGGVYAYALTLLAPHDDTLDWNHLARGILISAEQQQYPDGKWIGLLPDSIELTRQERRPWRINPCAIAGLRMRLDGRVDSLAVAVAGSVRVAAPFPVSIADGKATIRAQKGLTYQILVNGNIRTVQSKGTDVVELDVGR